MERRAGVVSSFGLRDLERVCLALDGRESASLADRSRSDSDSEESWEDSGAFFLGRVEGRLLDVDLFSSNGLCSLLEPSMGSRLILPLQKYPQTLRT